MRATHPFTSGKLYAPFKIAALIETLTEQGIPAEHSLAGTGLSPEHIRDADTRTSVRQYVQVCENALRLSTDSETPFMTGRRLHLFAYGMYGYALMSCTSLRDYFNFGEKYHLLAVPMLSVQWREGPEFATWLFPDEFTFAPSAELRRFLIEQQFTQHVTHLQDVAGKELWPVRAQFSFEKPSSFDLYHKYLGCDCAFDARSCELHYDKDILEQKPPLAHFITSALFQQTCEKLISQASSRSGVGGEVYQLLIRSPGKFANMDQLAKSMNLTSRTLRRYLAAEGLSFAEIIDDVRRTLSIEYLRTTNLNVEDISLFVGFGDVANFRRAFKRWTGYTPGHVRRTFANRKPAPDFVSPFRTALIVDR